MNKRSAIELPLVTRTRVAASTPMTVALIDATSFDVGPYIIRSLREKRVAYVDFAQLSGCAIPLLGERKIVRNQVPPSAPVRRYGTEITGSRSWLSVLVMRTGIVVGYREHWFSFAPVALEGVAALPGT